MEQVMSMNWSNKTGASSAATAWVAGFPLAHPHPVAMPWVGREVSAAVAALALGRATVIAVSGTATTA
jgi:hypothetical protein